MFAPDDVLILHPQTKLKHWQDQGVIFHPPSNATLLLSSVLVTGIKAMQTGAMTLNQITHSIFENYPELSDHEKNAVYETLEQGITSLVIDGIVRLEQQPITSEL